MSPDPALTISGEEWSRAALFDRAEKLARRLSATGVSAGDVVGIALPNSAAFIIATMAVMRLDAVTALLSPKFGTLEYRSIIEGLGLLHLLATPEAAGELQGQFSNDDESLWTPLGAEATEIPLALGFFRSTRPSALPPDLALIKITSGSTGVPKAVGLTAENLISEAAQVATTLEASAGRRILAPVSLAHSYGFDLGVLPMLFNGARLIAEPVFNPRRVLTHLAGGRIDIFLGVPSMYHFLRDLAPAAPPSLAAVEFLLSCTAPLSPELIATFHDIYQAPICQHYGSSECGAAVNHIPEEVLSHPRSVGKAMTGVAVTVVDAEGRAVPAGVEGEVVVASPAVASGYLMGAPDGPSPLRNGAFRTGDLGVFDGAGFLELRGRRDDRINVGGAKVSPLEVAWALESLPAVREALVYGVPDARGGEAVEAMVTLRVPADEGTLLKELSLRLADHKLPRRIHFRDELPRGATGKPQPPGRGGRR